VKHLDIQLDGAAQNFIEEHASIHNVSTREAAAMLIRSGARRLRASRRYQATPKGEASQARHEKRKQRGLVVRRTKRKARRLDT